MANITIEQSPEEFTPTYNEVTYVLSGTNTDQNNFKFVADVIIGGQTFRQAVFPDPVTGVGVIQIGRVFVDKCIELHLKKELDVPTAAMAKYFLTDMQCKVVDECLQLHGGYGYMLDYFIARAYVDSRAQRIYAGTNEIMKEIISKSLLDGF